MNIEEFKRKKRAKVEGAKYRAFLEGLTDEELEIEAKINSLRSRLFELDSLLGESYRTGSPLNPQQIRIDSLATKRKLVELESSPEGEPTSHDQTGSDLKNGSAARSSTLSPARKYRRGSF